MGKRLLSVVEESYLDKRKTLVKSKENTIAEVVNVSSKTKQINECMSRQIRL